MISHSFESLTIKQITIVSSSILLGSLNGNLMISRKVRKRKAEQNLLFYANNFLL